MAEKTENIRRKPREAASVDDMDRKILGELTRDATQSYAAIGAEVGLSSPAVHERVKRMRASGVIQATTAQIDGAAVGKPLLAYIHVDTEGWGVTKGLMALQDLPELEEIHSCAGDTNLILKVRVASPRALEGLLARIYDVDCVRATRTYTALSTHLERTVQAEVTPDLNAGGQVK